MTEWHIPTDPTLNEWGDETHPAFGQIQANRVSRTPGATLFESEIQHNHYVILRINRATRKRDLHRNWIHTDIQNELVEVAMSEAQWASFVSSMNTSGVPCTVLGTETDRNVAGLKFKPVLGESLAEVRSAAQDAFSAVKQASTKYAEALANGTAKQKREALASLNSAIEYGPANIEFAAKSLNEHAENVVQKARADVEAMVIQKAQQLALDPGTVGLPTLEIEAGDSVL